MMKPFLLLGLLALTACQTKKSETPYQIIGDIKNLPAEIIYLRIKKTAPDGHIYWPKVDSAEVENGKFILNKDTAISEPNSAMVIYIDKSSKKPVSLKFANNYEHKKMDNFIMENGKLSINGDFYDINGLNLTGSKETDFAYRYAHLFFRRAILVDLKIDSLLKTRNKMGLKESMAKRKELRQPLNTELKKILSENASLHSTLSLLFQNQNSFTATELEELSNLIDPKLLTTTLGQSLKKVIALKKVQEKIQLSS